MAQKKKSVCKKEINFFDSMVFTKEEAILNEVHRKECYDDFLESWDRGKLTLVNEKYFAFALELVRLVSSNFSRRQLKKDLNLAASASQKILKNKAVIEKFMDASKDHTELSEGQKKKIYFEILRKVKNSESSDVINVCNEEHTVRGSKNKETKLNLRQGLDSMSAENKKKKKEQQGAM